MKNLRCMNIENDMFSSVIKVNNRMVWLPIICGLLWACGGTGQDKGETSSSTQVFSGLALDGQIARATVYLDTNNNGKRDPWEDYAFTDNQGYYSFNPITETDYCAADADPQEAIYCLTSSSALGNVVIRIDSGYDILTGEPFLSQLSRRIDADVLEEIQNTIVSPLTSLLTNVDDIDERNSILDALGISDVADLDINYLDVLNNGSEEINTALFSAAIKLHKVVSVLSDRVNDNYDEIGDSFGAPNDASAFVYSSFANQILESSVNFEEFLSNEELLVAVLEEAESFIRDVYIDREYTLPVDIDSTSGDSPFNRAAEVASSIVEVVDNLVDVDDENFDAAAAIGSSRALEALIIKSVEELNEDSTVDNTIRFFSDAGNDQLISALVDSLGEESGDLSTLIDNDFVGEDFDTVEDIQSASSRPEGTEPFSNIAGLQLKVSDLDLGFGPVNLDDSEVEFYFQGEDGDVRGAFVACVKHVDDANVDGTLGEGNTRGELVDGFWSLLGASLDNEQSHSLLITVTFLGATYQAILQTNGTESINGQAYERIRFDLDGDIRLWHSFEGLTFPDQALPTTDQECEDRLPSRVGI